MERSEDAEHGLARLLFVSRTADLGAGAAPVAEFLGGVHYGWSPLGRSSAPFFQAVKLAVYPLGVRVSSRWAWLSLGVPLWEARFDELAEIRECRYGFRPAMEFVTSSHRRVYFWASRTCLGQVAVAMRACGMVTPFASGVA